HLCGRGGGRGFCRCGRSLAVRRETPYTPRRRNCGSGRHRPPLRLAAGAGSSPRQSMGTGRWTGCAERRRGHSPHPTASRGCFIRRRGRAGSKIGGEDRSLHQGGTQRMTAQLNSFRAGPDERGHFGEFGGRYVAETLMPLVLDLEKAYRDAKADPAFKAEFEGLLKHYVGRPSALYYAERMTEELRAQAGADKGAKIYFKREDLNHTGAHKINNCIGQILLALRMGKTRIIAETGAGQHGVATATVAARFGLPCVIYMGARDIERQQPNVFRMRLLGAEVRAVTSGSQTLKDAMNEALRDWVTNVDNTFYIIGTAAGPHPYPELVRDFQSVIGTEVREQILAAEGRLPDSLVAAVGGGSNAIGLFHAFLDEPEIE